MSDYYEPKVGDKVGVTISEAEVEDVTPGEHGGWMVGLTIQDTWKRRAFFIAPSNDGSVRLTKLKAPLPTTPGSVIRWSGSSTSKYVRLPNGQWFSLSTDKPYDESEFRPVDYTVVFDAAKVES